MSYYIDKWINTAAEALGGTFDSGRGSIISYLEHLLVEQKQSEWLLGFESMLMLITYSTMSMIYLVQEE